MYDYTLTPTVHLEFKPAREGTNRHLENILQMCLINLVTNSSSKKGNASQGVIKFYKRP